MCRSKTSKCTTCEYFIRDPYQCWFFDYISYRIWENCVGYECDKFESKILKNCNSHYVHRDYGDDDLFPEKKFGQGKFKFSSDGKIIGEL